MRLHSLIAILLLLALPLCVLGQEADAEAEAVDDPSQAIAEQPLHEPVNMGRRFKRHISGVESCLICHGSFNIVKSDGAVDNESLWVDPDRFLGSVHARLTCVSCHTNIDGAGHRLAGAFDEADGGHHGNDELDPGIVDPSALQALWSKAGGQVDREAALIACANCHQEIFYAYRESVHGQAVITEGLADPPYCTDCHGWHYVLPADDEQALTNPANIPGTCKNCHGQTEIKNRYDLTKNVAETYGESFHARRSEMGAGEIAVCTSCHGWHEIYAAEDPRSKVNIDRVSDTCGECHPGAQINFAAAFTHGEVSREELVGIYAVTQSHKWMIVLIVIPLVFLVFVHLIKMLRANHAKRAAKHE